MLLYFINNSFKIETSNCTPVSHQVIVWITLCHCYYKTGLSSWLVGCPDLYLVFRYRCMWHETRDTYCRRHKGSSWWLAMAGHATKSPRLEFLRRDPDSASMGPYCLSLFMEKETPGSSGSVCCNWIRPCENTNALTKTSVFVLTKLQKLCVYS